MSEPSVTLIGGETLYYPFYNTSLLDYASGTGVSDLSNNTGNVTFSTGQHILGSDSAYFSSAGYLQVKTAITPLSIGPTFSIAFWGYFTTAFADNQNAVFSMATTQPFIYSSWFVLGGQPQQTGQVGLPGPRLGVYFGGNSNINAPTINTNVWTHVVFTCGGGNVKWYINGTLGTQTYTGFTPAISSKPFVYIGAQPNISGQNNMYLSEFRYYYGTELTQSNVTALYNVTYTPASGGGSIPCFKEGTKILCLIDDTEMYVPVETIHSGTLVKTCRDGYKKVQYIGKKTIDNPDDDERIENRIYKCSTVNYPELTEDLYLTGHHSILVDELSEKEREKITNHVEYIYITDGKYRLMAFLDERAEPWVSGGNYTIWHFSLENEDYFMNYGVYANGGLLVETSSNRYMKELSNMEIL